MIICWHDICMEYVTFVDIAFATLVGIIFLTFVDKLSVAFINSSHTITELSAILFKYLKFSQIHVLRLQL